MAFCLGGRELPVFRSVPARVGTPAGHYSRDQRQCWALSVSSWGGQSLCPPTLSLLTQGLAPVAMKCLCPPSQLMPGLSLAAGSGRPAKFATPLGYGLGSSRSQPGFAPGLRWLPAGIRSSGTPRTESEKSGGAGERGVTMLGTASPPLRWLCPLLLQPLLYSLSGQGQNTEVPCVAPSRQDQLWQLPL